MVYKVYTRITEKDELIPNETKCIYDGYDKAKAIEIYNRTAERIKNECRNVRESNVSANKGGLIVIKCKGVHKRNGRTYEAFYGKEKAYSSLMV